jgi:beta-lactamase superfamily II metal-dependent hydrolase
MIRITFKNVGQGDTILLEWEKDKVKKLGVIDCKKHSGHNPVIDYIKSEGIEEISFLFLSHPHLDHCSGFADLIDYCISHKIKIKYFLHTSNNTPRFWRAAIVGKEEETEILRLFHKIKEASKEYGMNSHPMQANMINGDIPLDDEYSIKIIAPQTEHLYNYSRNYTLPPLEEEAGNNPSANWLATVFKIYSKKHDCYVLLTSDSYAETMYYDKYKPKDFSGKLILAQCPHHGASGNYKNAFWKLVNRNDNTPIVISVGHNSYGHPADMVISNLQRNNYSIYSTNWIGGLRKNSESPVIIETKLHLKTFGEFVSIEGTNKFSGDKIFEIDLDGTVKSLN